MFKKCTILAPGLLGASLGKALHKRNLVQHISVWARREEARIECLDQQWCSSVEETPEKAVADADLIFICAPVEHILPLLDTIAPHLKENAIVTDVGSTKGNICENGEEIIRKGPAYFIGSHPMAGSEKTGSSYSDADLFADRHCFITPLEESSRVESLQQIWEAIGMKTSITSPKKHDEIVANISHLPHFIASSLANSLWKKDHAWCDYSGPGLKDSIRISGGDPELWKQIFSENRTALLDAITGFEQSLQDLKSALMFQDYDDLKNILKNGQEYKNKL